MALRIQLPSGETVVIDEATGEIIPFAPADEDPAPPAEPPFDPRTDEVVEPGVVSLPGGKQVTYIRNGVRKQTWIPDQSSSGAVSGNTIYSAQQQASRDAAQRAFEAQQTAAQRAEQQRQFNEGLWFDKAKFDTSFGEGRRQFDTRFGEDQRQFDLGQDLDRGKTLLSLGSRPDTLIRYLYALRGMQPPQGSAPRALPGFQNVQAVPEATGIRPPSLTPQQQLTIPNPQTQAARMTAPTFVPAQVQAAIAAPPKAGDLAQYVAPMTPGGTPAATATNVNPDPLMRAGVTAANPIEARTVSAQNELLKQGRVPRAWVGNTAIFDEGGILDEPVYGYGTRTGRRYGFATDGNPEAFAPLAPPSLFNPAGGVRQSAMDFPQIQHFTGGTSYIPSAQRLSQSTGTERALYGGYLQDEVGISPDDVIELARRLAPQVTGLRTPRFAN